MMRWIVALLLVLCAWMLPASSVRADSLVSLQRTPAAALPADARPDAATAIDDRVLLFGAQGYGARQGRIMSVRLIVGAIAPFVFALMTERAGVSAAIVLAALSGCGAVAAFWTIGRLAQEGASARQAD